MAGESTTKKGDSEESLARGGGEKIDSHHEFRKTRKNSMHAYEKKKERSNEKRPSYGERGEEKSQAP